MTEDGQSGEGTCTYYLSNNKQQQAPAALRATAIDMKECE